MRGPLALLGRLADLEGSTRVVGLVRIALGLLAWAEHAREMRLFETLAPFDAAVGLTFFACSTAVVVGWHSRLACLGLGTTLLFCWQWYGEIGGDDGFRRHHTYTLAASITLLSLTPCGRSFSVDRWRALRRDGPAAPPEHGPLWATYLHRLQLSLIYFWGAYDKTFVTFPERMEHYLLYLYWGSDHPGPAFSILCVALAWGTVALGVRARRGSVVPAGPPGGAPAGGSPSTRGSTCSCRWPPSPSRPSPCTCSSWTPTPSTGRWTSSSGGRPTRADPGRPPARIGTAPGQDEPPTSDRLT